MRTLGVRLMLLYEVCRIAMGIRGWFLLLGLVALMATFGTGCKKEFTCIDLDKKRLDPCPASCTDGSLPLYCGCNQIVYDCECDARRDGVMVGYNC
jgi:hypothetical protein